MRIVHTSDWHVGRRFEREPLDADQRAFLGWLAEQVDDLGVDLVVVAGDVYDRSLPAEEAVSTLDAGLDALRAAGATVAMIPGNHDSARRLGFGARRQAQGGVHVFADDRRPPEPWVFEAGGEAVAVVAVPYLDPMVSLGPLPGPDGSARLRTHENVLADALSVARGALDALGPTTAVPSMAVAHATVAGSVTSDSEKQLAIGGADAVDAGIFSGFDYVALGHLHRPQRVSADGRIAYSGSPLPYSFSEDHQKSVRLVEIARGVVSVSEIVIPVGRPVVTLEGRLEELLDEPAHDAYLDHWVAARLTDTTTQVQPLERLRRRFPYAVHVGYARTGGPAAGLCAPSSSGPAVPRPVEDVVTDFLAELHGRPPEGWARELVLEAVETAHREGGLG